VLGALVLYVAQLVGIDINLHMVEVYNAHTNVQGLEPHEMRAVDSLTELQQQHFNVAMVHILSPSHPTTIYLSLIALSSSA